MDYFLIYRNGVGLIRAATPDVEGIYVKEINFSGFKHKIEDNEVHILTVDPYVTKSGPSYRYKVVSVFRAKEKVHVLVERCGFQAFFTNLIKEYLTKELGNIYPINLQEEE